MSKKNYENLPFEFYLRINGNERPIVGRNFNVRGYNSKSLSSMDIKYCIDEVVGMIEGQFRSKSEDYLYRYYDPYKKQTSEEIESKNIFEDEDLFSFEIKVHGKVVAQKQFSGNWYPPKVRYDVDIRKLIPGIISKIQKTLSSKNLTTEYAGIAL
tara:strand:+ start:8292 stop:8756 length:465 start_codon:yes stop_codon:yes gene_type:complete